MVSKQELNQYLISIKESDNNHECTVKNSLEIIRGRWKLHILAQLLKKEVVRFNELKREISGITNTMLSNSLHQLNNSSPNLNLNWTTFL